MTTTERTARLWLRAYPRRWRYAYGEDLVGTLLDLAGPDARTVRLGDGVSVVRAGWALRWREHPPLGPWLAYRLRERGLPAQYRPWLMDDLLGRFHALRSTGTGIVAAAVVLLGLVAVLPFLAPLLAVAPEAIVTGFGGMLLVTAVVQPRARARHIWQRDVSGWLPPELRPRGERWKAEVELAQYRASLRRDGDGYDGMDGFATDGGAGRG
ncbi:hypothetical protein Sked_35100 [Sanguibacter keddieii DSM 10542]|uniref:Uncharacterized protein n=1 Tax=Sanguibacter keddieii (strain ATCC 51767 / DSM 10542 / NCFB 3025 / ST-74) TaxID=446469 RepID=D1BEW2_SANKS|nr:hypothetical protein [Sanguibacter keddieii]ACZ23398.1 hypothetical protein Sked_35100 [Sanguibacter keddieii DSM 10542]